MSRYHFIKENKKTFDVKEILDKKYNGNLQYYKEAKEDLTLQRDLYCLSKKEPLLAHHFADNYICLDLINDETTLMAMDKVLLAASLDHIHIRRLLPSKPSDILKSAYNKDASNKSFSERNELRRILQNLENVVTRNTFTVMNLTHNRNNGEIIYNTRQNDSVYGSTMQYCWITLDKSKNIQLQNTINGDVKDLVDNNMMYNFFMMYGVNKIYMRCTCSQYVKYLSTKRTGGNFFCNHMMYSISMLPWWLYYTLNR